MKKITEEKREGQQKFWFKVKVSETLEWVWSLQKEILSFTMGINDNLQETSYIWQLVTSSYGPLHSLSEVPGF